MKQTYKHLTREERYSIEQMRKAGYKQNKIAELLCRSEGTISLIGLTMEQCQRIEDKLNMRPRKTLGFVAPCELYNKLVA